MQDPVILSYSAEHWKSVGHSHVFEDKHFIELGLQYLKKVAWADGSVVNTLS